MFSRNELVAAVLFLAVATAFGTGCSRKDSAPPGGDLSREPRFTGELAAGLSPEHIRKYQPDVRMVAHWVKGWVEVRVKNRTGRKINIGPGNFGAIAPRAGGGMAGGKIVPVKPGETKAMFPTTVLDPDTEASGWFQFRQLGNLEGGFMVFNHPDPDIRPSRCRIETKTETP